MAAKRSATHGISNREQILTAASALFGAARLRRRGR